MESLELSSPHLKDLRLVDCPNLRRLPRLPSSLSSLHLYKCESLRSMESLELSSPHLKSLHLKSCHSLLHLPRLPSSLSSLHLEDCRMKSLDLSSPNVTTSPTDLTLPPPHLKELVLLRCPKLRLLSRLPSSLSSLHLEHCDSMESLELVSPYVTTSPTDLTLAPHLKELHLRFCPKLHHLSRLPSSLSSLCLSHCYSLCSMEDLSNLKNLSYLSICSTAIEEIQGLGCLENLRVLLLWSLQQVKILPDLSNLNALRSLHVICCPNLVEIQGELPESLKVLEISCISLQKLPDLSSLNGVRKVIITSCTKLNAEAVSSLCSEKSVKFVEEDRSESEYEGEDAESESEYEGEDAESEYEGEDAESESEYEGEDAESEYEGEDAESESEYDGEDDEYESESEGED